MADGREKCFKKICVKHFVKDYWSPHLQGMTETKLCCLFRSRFRKQLKLRGKAKKFQL